MHFNSAGTRDHGQIRAAAETLDRLTRPGRGWYPLYARSWRFSSTARAMTSSMPTCSPWLRRSIGVDLIPGMANHEMTLNAVKRDMPTL